MAGKAPTFWAPAFDWLQLVKLLAAAGRNMILRRAFPPEGAGRDVFDRAFPRLSPKYATYKKRKGRNAEANQQFTGMTLKAMRVLRAKRTFTGAEATVGFSTRRDIAERLQKRNKFMGHTAKEERSLMALFAASVNTGLAAKYRIRNGRLVIGQGR